ncbi:diacylglycerol kinase [uncultured Legionella sp.]|uniref:diacylglycerol kinase n=1 Tax=uncultured Legionella sp. TaxID=210934 RepID=UPI002621930B|nr:diacylglycerol kinase [uncultured Legionella sp.]
MMEFIRHLHRTYQNSCNGLKKAWHLEWAFRVELVVFICSVPAAIFLGSAAAEYILLIGSLLLILIMELFNSAIEATVDRIGREHHELSGRAKDLASAAVLVAIINAVITWGLIFVYWILSHTGG